MSSTQYRNVRTGKVVDVDDGSPLQVRLSRLPLVWRPEPAPSAMPVNPLFTPDARPAAPEPLQLEMDPGMEFPAAPVRPRPGDTVGAWREYAKSRGGDPTAVDAAPKAALVALYAGV